mmetsp:Transcript_39805/g.84859  ORF Transcript_39805/g.84859 Transcript_39805/m.84859 type:complete len:310 (-) Transcript_39805:12-941(-)
MSAVADEESAGWGGSAAPAGWWSTLRGSPSRSLETTRTEFCLSMCCSRKRITEGRSAMLAAAMDEVTVSVTRSSIFASTMSDERASRAHAVYCVSSSRTSTTTRAASPCCASCTSSGSTRRSSRLMAGSITCIISCTALTSALPSTMRSSQRNCARIARASGMPLSASSCWCSGSSSRSMVPTLVCIGSTWSSTRMSESLTPPEPGCSAPAVRIGCSAAVSRSVSDISCASASSVSFSTCSSRIALTMRRRIAKASPPSTHQPSTPRTAPARTRACSGSDTSAARDFLRRSTGGLCMPTFSALTRRCML